MSKFFAPPKYIKGDHAVISGDEAHHIVDVMRLKAEDHLQFFDGTGKIYAGRIVSVSPEKVVKIAITLIKTDTGQREVEITLAQALPKKKKMEYIIGKCTELGVDVIIPVATARTVIRLEKERAGRKNARWQKIAQEAAKQCGRATITDIRPMSSWQKIINAADHYDFKLLPCLSEKTKPLKEVLREQTGLKSIIVCIGPEGGFTPQEIDQAQKYGFSAVSLGKNVLKSDTAAIAVLAMINYELGL
ncbi:MAG: 16S rRNA (uracil(1498)-N(3))-methyltransferase [Candidatus Omnitrophota bacterium]